MFPDAAAHFDKLAKKPALWVVSGRSRRRIRYRVAHRKRPFGCAFANGASRLLAVEYGFVLDRVATLMASRHGTIRPGGRDNQWAKSTSLVTGVTDLYLRDIRDKSAAGFVARHNDPCKTIIAE